MSNLWSMSEVTANEDRREHPAGGMSEGMALAVIIFGKEIK